MKIYRLSAEDKLIKWECPITGIYITAHFIDTGITNGYSLYHADNSFIDIFDNFFHAANWAKKHLDAKCKIPTSGKRIS